MVPPRVRGLDGGISHSPDELTAAEDVERPSTCSPEHSEGWSAVPT